jgi:hypothetical protein
MPKDDFYDGMDDATALEAFANHHYDPGTRHVSEFEHDLLMRCVEQLRASEKMRSKIARLVAA